MNLIDRAKKILTTPKTEWDVIDNETPNIQGILTTYVIPLVAIGTIASFIGWGFIGKSYYGFKVASVSLGIRYALIAFVAGVAGCFILAYVIDALAPTFKSEKNLGKSFQLAAYASTAGWVGAVLNIIPSLAIVGSLVGLYNLYLLYLGLPKLKKTPQEQGTGYFVACLVTMIVVGFVLAMILAAILVPKVSAGDLGL